MHFYTTHKRIAADLWANIRLRTILRMTNPRSAKILDLGCGPGYFGRALTQLSNDVYYADISREELDSFDAPADRKFLCDATQKLPFADESFDWIFCGDMLEHVEDDDNVLANMHKILRLRGRGVFLVPAYSRLYGHHDKLIGHVKRYDRKPFKLQLQNAGFKVLKWRYVCSLIFPPFLLNQLLARSDTAYQGISILEYKIIPLLNFIAEIDSRIRLPFGIGLIFVVSK